MRNKVLVFTSFYLPGVNGGGPIKTISNLVENTKHEIDYSIVTSDRDLGDNKPFINVSINHWNKFDNYRVYYKSPEFLGLNNVFQLIDESDFDVVYLNSFFSLKYSLLPFIVSKLKNKKVIISPRGELSKGALKIKAFKKNIFIHICKILNLYRNVIFQASSDFEARDIKNILGNRVEIFVAENIAAKSFSTDIKSKNYNVTRIVSLSRVAKIKNIKYSLELLRNLKSNIVFDLYGPLEDSSYWEECCKVIESLPSNIVVNYKGVLSPLNVIETLSDYDLFLMPTKGENYGHAIVEAFCSGLPTLIADTTPWRNLKEQGLGWDISLNETEGFINAIEYICNMSVDGHYKMRQHILSWANYTFSQNDKVEKNIAMFRYAFENK